VGPATLIFLRAAFDEPTAEADSTG
jgi:hypothetical protein